jgi:phage terminase large subunit-like protein
VVGDGPATQAQERLGDHLPLGGQRAREVQGLTRDWVHLDEEPPKPIFEEIVARVGAGRGLRVFISATLLPPEGMAGGISWLYEELIRPWQSGTRPDVAVFGASIYDNPQLGRDEIARLEASIRRARPSAASA